MYHYDLLKSIDLGKVLFSDSKEIHCCFNIWKRPNSNNYNKPPSKKIEGIELKEVRKSRNQFLPNNWDYDLGICTWGSVGKEVEFHGQFNQELYIKVTNEPIKDEVLKLLKEANWIELYPMTKSPRLKQWQIIKYLKENLTLL